MAGKVFLAIVFAAFFSRLNAQICTGSLGDPIVNITFGSGANPGPALSSAITNYQYISTDCPQDGYYTIRNNTSACHGNTWHSATDHTGNTNGYFMLVNASVSPGTFYLDTVRGLCANTTFEFASWVMNMLKSSSCGGAGIQPNLTFRIERTDGSVVQSYNSGDIPASSSPQWRQYGFFFTTPAGVSDVVLRIINNAPGGCGNDLALDDITFRACGPQIATSIAGIPSNNVALCEGTSQSYTFNETMSAGFNNPVVQWQESRNGDAWTDIPGATASTYTLSFSSTANAGTYAFRVVAAEAGNMSSTLCRVASMPLQVIITPNPLPAAISNSPACEGGMVALSITGNDAAWSGPNGFAATGKNVSIGNASLNAAGTYYVTAINGSCTRTDSTLVIIHPAPVIVIAKTSVDVCSGDTAHVAITGATTYTWQPVAGLSYSAGVLDVQAVDSTSYTIKGQNAFGCSDSVVLQVNAIHSPAANAGPDHSIMEGSAVRLAGTATGDSIFYAWIPNAFIDDPHNLAPWVNPPSDTSYIFRVNSYLGCRADEDTVQIHVFKKLTMPNSFSPNGDGINDYWTIRGLESYPGAAVTIFDRSGQKVYGSFNFEKWQGLINGKPLPVGVYYWVIDVHNGFAPYKGWVLLLR